MRYHLDYTTLMEHHDALGCSRLIVTHMSGDMLGGLDSLVVEAATDGMEIVL